MQGERTLQQPATFNRRIFVRNRQQQPKVQKITQQPRASSQAPRRRSTSKRKPIFGDKSQRRTVDSGIQVTFDTIDVPVPAEQPKNTIYQQPRNTIYRQQNSLDLSVIQRKSLNLSPKVDGLMDPQQFAYLGYLLKQRLSLRASQQNC